MKNSTTEKRPGPARGIGVAARCRLLCLLSLLAPAVLFAQPTRITGSVANENGEAIAGATIIVRGTQQGTTTDGNGSFALDIPADGATLTVSFIGYATREVAVSSQRTEVRIVLQADMIAVDEVVVVGYGEQLRRTVTSSVAKLDGDALQNLPISNASEGLKGKIAGLRVTQTNFTPGGEFTYQIRGGSSINGTNAPLVLVDGVERDFSAINPNDIASIEGAQGRRLVGHLRRQIVERHHSGDHPARRLQQGAAHHLRGQLGLPEHRDRDRIPERPRVHPSGPFGGRRVPQRPLERVERGLELPQRTALGRHRQQTRRQILDPLLQPRDRRAARRLPDDARPGGSLAHDHVPRHRLAGPALQRRLVAELLPRHRRRRRARALLGQSGLHERSGRGPLDGIRPHELQEQPRRQDHAASDGQLRRRLRPHQHRGLRQPAQHHFARAGQSAHDERLLRRRLAGRGLQLLVAHAPLLRQVLRAQQPEELPLAHRRPEVGDRRRTDGQRPRLVLPHRHQSQAVHQS